MIGLFLQDATIYGSGGAAAGAFATLSAFVSVFSLIFFIAIYLYFAIALMSLAKKTKTKPAWLAFIPIANLYLLSQMAGMHWWPILLIIGNLIPLLNIVTMIILAVYTIIWFWKTFEAVGRPGWWAIFSIVPILNIVFLILLGVAAWGKSK